MRARLYDERGRRCEGCGVSLEDVAAAFAWYADWFSRVAVRLFRWFPSPGEFRDAAGYAGAGHVWELNHKLAVIEGGALLDPDNLEVLCLRCHRPHTALVVKRRAKAKRVAAKFHNGKF
jgi:hypothetical protein